MCGIASVFSYHRVAAPVDREELLRVRDAMAARGPDGRGAWYSPDGRVGLAHRRLSIIDLSEQGAQPMSSEDGAVTVTFNGEIYNYRELRAELEAAGHAFRSTSDTEVILRLYADKGIAMLQRLRGMFAFVLWDQRQGAMYLARDPYGIKPLYYADDGWQVRAASQVKALVAGGRVPREREPAAVAGFYLLGNVPEPWTLYRGVFAVPAGHYVRVDATGVGEPTSWCDVTSIFMEASRSAPAGSAGAIDDIHGALQDSVKAHLVADVPVGLFLSSGIDSGALAGMVRDQGGAIETLTLGFEEYAGTADDEVPLAQEIARHYGLPHRAQRVSRGEFAATLPAILASMDQPSIDGINTWLVSRAAAAHGWKVALSGLGGDELLGGYPSFTDIPKWVALLAIPSRIPMLGAASYRVAARMRGAASPKLAGMVKYGGSYAGAYLLRRGIFLPDELPAVMGVEAAREGLRRLRPLELLEEPIAHARASTPAAAKVSALESALYMRSQLLRDADWAGMAHSLEIRTPLVDIELLRRVAPLIGALAAGDGKRALGGAPAVPLPEHIRNRPKTGFTVPVDRWLQGNRDFDAWKAVPSLRDDPSQPWVRRWAYTVMTTHDAR